MAKSKERGRSTATGKETAAKSSSGEGGQPSPTAPRRGAKTGALGWDMESNENGDSRRVSGTFEDDEDEAMDR